MKIQNRNRIYYTLCFALFFGACVEKKLSFSEEALIRIDAASGMSGEAIFHGIDGYHRLPFKDVNGYAIAGLDMVLGRTEEVLEQSRILEAQGVRTDALVGAESLEGNQRLKWGNGVVPYEIHPSANRFKAAIEGAAKEWNSKTAVTWKERTNERSFVEFKYGEGCWSYIGHIGGMQTISLSDYCNSVGPVAHEMAHALGFLHEHQRRDRDDYVEVLTDRLPAGYESWFGKDTRGLLLTDYDFNSITHYDGYWFRPAPGQNPGSIGMGNSLSAKDVAGARRIYGDGGLDDDDDGDDDDDDGDDDDDDDDNNNDDDSGYDDNADPQTIKCRVKVVNALRARTAAARESKLNNAAAHNVCANFFIGNKLAAVQQAISELEEGAYDLLASADFRKKFIKQCVKDGVSIPTCIDRHDGQELFLPLKKALTKDCAETWGGEAVVDECGVCNGTGIPEGACDCAGNQDLGCGCGEPAEDINDNEVLDCHEDQVCGNGVLESGEACDDGNLEDGDNCSSTCQSEICAGARVDSAAQIAALSGCTRIQGSLEILKAFDATDVFLPNLQSLSGKLVIKGTKNLESVNLPALVVVGDVVKVSSNRKLEQLLLPEVGTANGGVRLTQNHVLKEVDLGGNREWFSLEKVLNVYSNQVLESLTVGPLGPDGQRKIKIRRNGSLSNCQSRECVNENF